MRRVQTMLLLMLGASILVPVNAGAAYPVDGVDRFEASASIAIGADPTCTAPPLFAGDLVGETSVQRSSSSTGERTVQTELISMDLSGSVPGIGSIVVRHDPERRSMGTVEPTVRGADYPAASHFDVFFEVEVVDVRLRNIEALAMTASIEGIPPITTFRAPAGVCTPLARADGPPVPVFYLQGASFTPEPVEDCGAVVAAGHFASPSSGHQTFEMSGARHLVRGLAPTAAEPVTADLRALSLEGVIAMPGAPSMPLRLHELPQTGSPGRLLGDPGVAQVDSFFDVFFEITVETRSGPITDVYQGRLEGDYGPSGGTLRLVQPASGNEHEMLLEHLTLTLNEPAVCP